MILIPQRLFESPDVKVIMRDGNVCILQKELHKPVNNREGYISNHVVSIVLSGKQQIRTYDETLLEVKAGELLFIPRGVYYISDLLPEKGAFKSILFYFDDLIIQEFLANTTITEFSKAAIPDHLKFGTLAPVKLFVDALLQIYQSRQLKQKAFLRLKIMELLHLLNSLASEQQFADFLFRLTLPKKRNIKSFMEDNYDKPLKVEDYAYLTGRSESTFRRDFKSFYDTTPQKWLSERRLEKALQIIHSKEISVTELAYEIGYENISYFIKTFKQKTGLSPKQYILSRKGDRLQH